MQTKTRLTLAAALAACFLGGTGAYVAGKSQAEARGEALLAAATAPQSPMAEVLKSPPLSPAPALTLQEKIDQAIAAWRATTDERLRTKALAIIDALSPEEIPAAQAAVAKVKDEYGLHLALAKRVALLWGRTDPAPALAWLTTELPREHRQEPMQAILASWSRRDPKAAFTWWRGIADSLAFPIEEESFERFETVIFSGWAANDPAALAASLPAVASAEEFEAHRDNSNTLPRCLGLAAAVVEPATREATMAAIADIPSEGTRAVAAHVAATMLMAADAPAAREFLVSLKIGDPKVRAELFCGVSVLSALMLRQEPDSVIPWLRQHNDAAALRNALDHALKKNEGGDLAGTIQAFRTALEKP